MAKRPLDGVLQHLRKLAAVQTYRELSDGDLLERFVGARDEAAFTVLIERHGPMVLGVCRRALPGFHDAEDACQATFLVLARKADSVRKKASLSSWLHGVACRAASKLKRDHARRVRREGATDAPTQTDPAAEVSWREVQGILDEELELLPERYRTPVILCYLDGMTRDEAARRLGLTPGSLHGRLERARHLLRRRLDQRGLTLAAMMSVAVLSESAAQAALAPTFVVSSTRAALSLAAGQHLTERVVAAQVLNLTREVLKTMFLTKLKLGSAAVLCAGLFAALIGGSFVPRSSAQDAKPSAKLEGRLHAASGAKTESDTEFIRRISKDLRSIDPSPAEMHFFVASRDNGKRQRLIDLFIEERQARQKAEQHKKETDQITRDVDDLIKAAELKELIEKEMQKHRNQKKEQDKKEQLPLLPNDVNGVIEKIDPQDPALLSISIGSDAGLAMNHTLDVYRLKPAPLYLGKIRIVNVTAQKAVSRACWQSPSGRVAPESRGHRDIVAAQVRRNAVVEACVSRRGAIHF
jgi:RNA polymerase sigma factor (sigma-70 family)